MIGRRNRSPAGNDDDVELIDPQGAFDGVPFGVIGVHPRSRDRTVDPDAPGHEPGDQRGQRARTAVAGGLVGVLLAGALVFAAATGDDAATLPNTSAPVTTSAARSDATAAVTTQDSQAAPSTTRPQPELRERGYVIDPPTGWSPAAAYSNINVGGSEGWDLDMQVWSEPSSTPETSPWLTLATMPEGWFGWSDAGARRITLANGIGLISVSTQAHTTLQWRLTNSVTGLIEARGLTDAEIINAANSVTFADSIATIGDLPDGLRNLIHTATTTPVFSLDVDDLVDNRHTATWSSPTGALISITSGAPQNGGTSLVPFLLSSTYDVTAGGHTFVVGRNANSYGGGSEAVAVTTIDDTMVVIHSAVVDRRAVQQMLSTLRLASSDEWRALLADGQPQIVEGSPPGQPTTVAGATEPFAWSIGLDGTGHVFVDVPSAQYVSDISPDRPIQTIVTYDSVLIFAATSATGADGTILRVTTTSGTTDHSMIVFGDNAAAGTQFTELGPYHADLLAADGNVLATIDG